MSILNVEHLTHTLLRKVTVWKDGLQKTYDYTGSTKDLLKQLEEVQPDDVLIEEPSLESLFMNFYKEEKA